jgi:hypothetical protein
VQKVRDGIGEVDSKITACRRVAQELNAASRQAEEVATRLDQALRQNRKLNAARAAAPPRELAEPIGLAERLAGRAPPMLAAMPVIDAIPILASGLTDRIAEVAVERLLAAEMVFPSATVARPERLVFRLTLD